MRARFASRRRPFTSHRSRSKSRRTKIQSASTLFSSPSMRASSTSARRRRSSTGLPSTSMRDGAPSTAGVPSSTAKLRRVVSIDTILVERVYQAKAQQTSPPNPPLPAPTGKVHAGLQSVQGHGEGGGEPEARRGLRARAHLDAPTSTRTSCCLLAALLPPLPGPSTRRGGATARERGAWGGEVCVRGTECRSSRAATERINRLLDRLRHSVVVAVGAVIGVPGRFERRC